MRILNFQNLLQESLIHKTCNENPEPTGFMVDNPRPPGLIVENPGPRGLLVENH
jgi:hypothetical protein